jgi:hypothetical protein
MLMDLGTMPAFVKIPPLHGIEFFVDLNGVQFPIFLKPLRQTKRRIARIGPDFQDVLWVDDLGQHTQDPPLKMSRDHSGLDYL